MGKEIGMFVDRQEHVLWNGRLDSLSESQLTTLEEQMLEIEPQGDPAKLVELRRQLGAGAVVIEAVAPAFGRALAGT